MWFFFVLFYIFVDYGRPQDVLPVGFLRPGMVSILILTLFLVLSNKIGSSNSKQTRLILYFTALIACYVPFATNNYYAFLTTRDMLLFMPFILSTIIVVNSIDRLKIIINFIIGIMIYVSIFSLFHHGKGTGNYFKDENDLSLFINTFLPFCYFLFLCEKKKKIKFFYAAGMISGILGIVASFSRGGFLGLLVMVAVAWWFSPKKILSLLVIGMLALCLFYYGSEVAINRGSTSYLQRLTTATDTQNGTGRERIESWKAAWAMFLHHPFGVGGNNFQVLFPEYQTSYFHHGMWGRVAHSLWFTLLSELGIIGVLIYLSLLYYNLKDIFHLKRLNATKNVNRDSQYLHYLALSFLASFAGYFTSGTFLSVLYYPHYWYLTALLVSARRIGDRLVLEA